MNSVEKNFIEWLSDKVQAQSPLSAYPKAIKELIPKKLRELGESKHTNLFECQDIRYLKNLYERMSKQGDLAEYNRSTRNQLPSAALKKYIAFLGSNTLEDKKISNNVRSMNFQNQSISLNQILYGPPGTGKTYNTINRALEIIDGIVPEDRSEAKARFEELSSAGQIEFVTFHQSYGYEEFVEGIKANSVDGEISYDVEDGIFKKLSKLALNKNCKITAEKILEKAIQNVKALSFTTTRGVVNVSLKDNGSFEFSNHHNMTRSNAIKSLNIFLNSKNINEITPDSLMDIGANGHRYTRYLFTKRLYELYATESKNLANHILIIDEINRGNISKIFGELITLIEPSKRIGALEEIRLRLPYSNEEFGVPSNLYILGTMNTADRSIALMDTALRRRFEFVEMMPDAALLDFEVEGVHLKSLLQTINARVEYLYDRDHTIGHAYFMELDESSSLAELNAVMRNKIIPLLQEYFYDDWEKIKLVLNDGFIHSSQVDAQTVFESIDDEYIEDEKLVYSILNVFEKEAYLRLCQTR